MKHQKRPSRIATFSASAASAAASVITLTGCAGPTSPLGAVWAVTPSAATKVTIGTPTDDTGGGPKIRFTPNHQVLHGPAPMKVTIENLRTTPNSDLTETDFQVRYNGMDVTRTFLRGSQVTTDYRAGKITVLTGPVRLPSHGDNQIEVTYQTLSGELVSSRYEPPRCYAFRPKPVRSLGSFNPSPSIPPIIERASQESGLNPAFFTGLVAQESSFNPKVVSWAKALGLTQVTTVAEAEFLPKDERYEDWPRYPGLNKLPVPVVKAFVLSGRINRNNEWRLDHERSIRGGIAYTMILAEKWSAPDKVAKLRVIFADPESAHTKLILASYHSGYSRVYSALNRYGKHWLRAPELKEARKYVNRIFSYCDHFSDVEEEEAYEKTS